MVKREPGGSETTKRLLGGAALHASSVVANCAMNRERQLAGVNSYARVLGFDVVERLAGSGMRNPAWLDLCCGSGRALVQAAEQLPEAVIVGVDLVDAFVDAVPGDGLPGDGLPGDGLPGDGLPGIGVSFVVAPAEEWVPPRAFDLITCVHGLHYVGDKLGLLSRVVRWLRPGGCFAADLDLESIRLAGGGPAGRRLAARLRAAGLVYDARRRRISCTGPVELELPYVYLGADDRAGANYTGQPAVHSFYRTA